MGAKAGGRIGALATGGGRGVYAGEASAGGARRTDRESCAAPFRRLDTGLHCRGRGARRH